MCDTIYSIYWWELEPYVEKHFNETGTLNLTGIIFETADILFQVVFLNLVLYTKLILTLALTDHVQIFCL